MSHFSPWQKELFYASIFGRKNKRSFPKQYRVIQKLNLFHLITPSGLHLNLIFWPLRKALPIYSLIVSFLLYTLSFQLTFYYSIKRVLLFKLIQSFFLKSKKASYLALYLTFFFDILWGTFSSSIISFCLSFIFILLFVAQRKKNAPPLLLSLTLVYYFLSYCFDTYFNPLAAIFSFLITPVFISYFLFSVLSLFVPFLLRLHSVPHNLLWGIVEFFSAFVDQFYSWNISTLEASLAVIAAFSKGKCRFIFLGLMILTHLKQV